MTSPVERHHRIRYLLRDLMSRSASGALRPFPGELLEALIGPPASVARWISQFHPELREKATLRICIIGASGPDSVDSGSWYGLIPWMLGNEEQKIEVTLVGPELFSETLDSYGASRAKRDETWQSPAAQAVARLMPPARLVPTRVDAYLGSEAGQQPVDLYFAFNPGIEDEQAWLEPGNLDAICVRGAPIGLASYCEQERVTEVEVLETVGYRVADRHELNPFGGAETPVGKWAGSFWEVLPLPPAADFEQDPQRQEALLAHFEQASDFLEVHGRPPIEEAGMVVALKLPREARARNIIKLLTPFIAVDRDSGELILFNSEGHVDEVADALPEELMARFPDGEFSYAHLRWAYDADEVAVEMLEDGDDFDPDFGDAPEAGQKIGRMEEIFRTLRQAALTRQRQAPPGSEAAEDDRLFPMEHDDMLANMAGMLKMVTGKDVDPEKFMEDMRAAGGIHGPTNDAWLNLFSHLDWDLTELTEAPSRLEPAFEVHAKSGVTLPVICEAYQYLPGDDKDELAEEAKANLAAAYPDGAILVFKVMPYKTVGDHRYAFGGLLYWNEQWRPFALCDSMRSLDSLLEQREAGFSFNSPDPRYAEDLGLSRALALMTSGYDPNERRRVLLIRQGDWVAEIPDSL